MLKVASHGSKLKNFPESLMPEEMRMIVRNFYLLEFADCSLTMLDASLLSAFVERWHPETSSFHLPFGDMTMTLDDVDALFHILIAGIFSYTSLQGSGDDGAYGYGDLEVSETHALQEFGEI